VYDRRVNPHIFREYDIRGVADADLSDSLARDLGRALGTFVRRDKGRRVALGSDCRLSSPRLHAALSEGLLQTGVEIVDLGMVPTPMMYFAVHHFDLDGGVQITGSHNPPQDNGFKLMVGKRTLFGAEIQELKAIIDWRDFTREEVGTTVRLDPLPAYVGFMKGNFRFARKDLRFAIDAGNGAGGPTAVATMSALGLSPITLLCEPDGAFPVHHPDPSEPHNLELLKKTVLENRLEVGIAYDGDADRVGVLDSRGEIIWGDRLLIALSRAVLRDRPGGAIVGEVKCSQTLYDDVARQGGRPILWKTGHSLIKAKMKEEKALLAGEMSGHVFFADRYYGFDDAVYASLRLLEIIARSEVPLHELLSDVPPTFVTPEIRVPCADDRKFGVVDGLKKRFAETHEVITVDGARILFGDGWGLVRASNTQPVLVLRFEAQSEARLDAIRADVTRALADSGVSV
jgi:phosphomannomutase/phosphoglucomutase